MSSDVRYRPGRYAAVLATAVLGVGAIIAATPAAQAAPTLARPSAGSALEWEFEGVSCTSASACTAVGDQETSAGATAALAERWNGTTWAVQTSPAPAGAGASYLNAVSCAAASACAAVGQALTSGGAAGLAEAWNGTAWTVQSTPTPAGAADVYLEGVSCTSASACTAVGIQETSAGATAALAERWNGTAWTVQSTPVPSGAAASQLYAVSCTSTTACTATGYYQSGTSELTLAETWNGTAWTVQTTPSPAGATSAFLQGVSCSSASACTATGQYETAGGVTAPLAEAWNGTTWTVQTTPSPAGAVVSYLDGVSCTSASACTATGAYDTGISNPSMTLAERWNGTTWTVQTSPNPSGSSESYLDWVSCGSASACIGVGYDITTTYKSLAEGWNGTTWAVQSTPTP